MPNWCEIDLVITGPKEDLDRMVAMAWKAEPSTMPEYADIPRMNFDALIPYPEVYKLADEHSPEIMPGIKGAVGFNGGGYEWCIKHWGTKWGACQPGPLKITKKSVKQTFSTAWSPPRPILLALAKKFPSLTVTAKYYERGAGYQGVLEVKGKQVITSDDGAYAGKRGG